jgi:hypothetical protein
MSVGTSFDFCLIFAMNLKGHGFGEFVLWAAIEPKIRQASQGEFHGKRHAGGTTRRFDGRAKHTVNSRIGKKRDVERGGFLSVFVKPKARCDFLGGREHGVQKVADKGDGVLKKSEGKKGQAARAICLT